MKYRPGKLRRLGVVLSALWFITFAGWGPTSPTFPVDYFLDRFETKQKWACHQKNDWRFEDGTVPIEVKKQTEDSPRVLTPPGPCGWACWSCLQ
jgi:hypothetical protein